MQKRIGITLLLIALLSTVYAQKQLNYAEVDRQSYLLYEQQKWKELIAYSDQARKQGIDFFYLKARTGIAYFNLKKYRVASEWFLKAWKNDQSFHWLQEYLYYSLLYAGRAGEAVKYASSFSPQMQQKVAYKKSKLTRLALETGYCYNPDFDKFIQKRPGHTQGNNDAYTEAYYFNNYHFESFDLNHRVSPSFYINHNLTFLGSKREQAVDWGQSYTFPVNTNQFQYFINPVFLVGKKLYFSTSLSSIWGSTEYYAGYENSNSNRQFYPYSHRFSDVIFSSSLLSNFGPIAAGAEVNFANIYNEKFAQMSAWITIYPFSTANFYFTPRVYLKSDTENGVKYNTFGISGGVQLGQVNLHAQYLSGDMENFVEAAGYVISNFPGTSESKFTGSLYFPFARKYQFVLRYINQDVTENTRTYTNASESSSTKYTYTKHTFSAGISWNF